ncbi:hypothetical protein G6F68_017494 [Rhizopus microsporus]|nr:hypothetical protein G6F68_017494 [Rhizopus microsporus]
MAGSAGRGHQPLKARQQRAHGHRARPEDDPLAPDPVGQHADKRRQHEADGPQHHAGKQRGRGRPAQFLAGVGGHVEADDLRADHAADHQQDAFDDLGLVVGEDAAQGLVGGGGARRRGRLGGLQRFLQVAANGRASPSPASVPW